MKSCIIPFLLSVLTVHFAAVIDSYGQRKRFSGYIIDSKSLSPVPYASIRIVGAYEGTASNSEDKDSLSISSIGYKTKFISLRKFKAEVLLEEDVKILSNITVRSKIISPFEIVQNAFKNIKKNYISQPFKMKTFYRHYCKDDSLYGRLIEAAVDIYKPTGYGKPKSSLFVNDAIQLIQSRRSFDKTFIKERHAVISYDFILRGDLAAYQNRQKTPIPYMLSNGSVLYLRAGLKNYNYELEETTYLNGEEVFVIHFSANPWWNSNKMTYKNTHIEHYGKFYITANNYAFIKLESYVIVGARKTTDQIFYKKGKDGYHLSNIVHDNQFNIDTDSTQISHKVHIELLVNDIVIGQDTEFKDTPITKEILAANVYNPLFWDNYVTITENPLESQIKRDLEKGQNLEGQFVEKSQEDFKMYEDISSDYSKLQELLSGNKNELIYIDFWASWCRPCITEFNKSKKIVEDYVNKGVRFIYVSLDDRKEKWSRMRNRFGLQEREHLRIGSYSSLLQDYEIKEIPRYMLIRPDGTIVENAPNPTSEEFSQLIDNELELLDKVNN